MLVEYLILGLCELCTILCLAVLTEDCLSECQKSVVELAEFLEALVAGSVKRLVALGRSDPGIPNQRLGVGGLLRFEIEC